MRAASTSITRYRSEIGNKRTPFEFEHQGTRELTAHDYVYAIRRLATTRIKSPSFSPLAEKIKGLKEYGEQISAGGCRSCATAGR